MGLLRGLADIGLDIAEGIGTVVKGIGKAGIKGSERVGGSLIRTVANEGMGEVATAVGLGAIAGGMIASADNKKASKGALIGGTTVGAGIALASPLGIPAAGIATSIGASAIGIGMQTGISAVSLASSAVKMPEGPVMQNLNEIKLKGWAIPVVTGAALLSGTKQAIRSFEKSRMGTNDGRLRTQTPDIPIQQQQNNYSVNGRGGIDFSGTGASGDLVFAMR